MRKLFPCLIFLIFCSLTSFGQTVISGTVTDAGNSEPLAGVSIVVKGKVIGTITNANGEFKLDVKENPPLTLVFSFVGYVTQEVQITDASTSGLKVSLPEQTILGQEIVVSATRVPVNILESPVSIEQMDIIEVQTTPADNYYKGLANLKGVDVTTSSINFQILNARGFGSTGNTRFVQLTDGMDTQAPALNFPIGNLNGPSELDVESVELIPGASSALYGPNAFNGIVLVTSKNPFEYQGLSAFAKAGLNHVGSNADYNGPALLWDGALRYAKAFNNKFAFKANIAYMRAQDWHGTDTYDKEAARKPDGFSFNPGADRLHFMGDEAAINLAIFPFSTTTSSSVGWQTLAEGPLGTFSPGTTAWEYAQNGWLPNHVVSITPFQEKHLVNYGAENLKLNGGLYYRLNDKVELSYLYNGGFGTSVYTGAQRYSLSDFSIQQHRLQLRGDNFFIRAYTTLENSGDSYIAEFLAKRLNDIRSGGSVSTWLGTYAIYYLRYLYDQGYTDPAGSKTGIDIAMQEAAHNYARQQTDGRYPLTPGTSAFNEAKNTALKGVVPVGPKFQDKTALYQAEAQYDFKNEIDFMELLAGGSFRMFDLNSNGTIFDDREQNITISEYGAYLQAGKWFANNKLKLSGSARYDKNQNFKGRLNPRISALIKAGESHNFRLSYQTGFRIPSTQGQHIDLDIVSSRLLGGLQRYADKYNLERTSTTGQPLAFEGTSVQAFRREIFAGNGFPAAVAQLVPFTEFNPVKPEQIQAMEVGYKSLINNNVLIDLSYYYNIYNDFITNVIVVTAGEGAGGAPNYPTILNGTSNNTFSIYTNAPGEVTAMGAVAGVTVNLAKGYSVSGNYNWNKLGDVPEGFIAEFNTPEHKMNFSVGNRKLTENLGFNVTWRWQSEFDWQSSFTNYTLYPVPSYNTLDAQISYKVPSMKSLVKIGGSNILNNKYIQSGGGPNISGLYYVSITFDQLMN